MERNFYPEDFEKFLKHHADQFKMSPSKKVWHGIYNDLQPGRRWPSAAISLLFILTFVIIGHLNTTNGSGKLLTAAAILGASNNHQLANQNNSINKNIFYKDLNYSNKNASVKQNNSSGNDKTSLSTALKSNSTKLGSSNLSGKYLEPSNTAIANNNNTDQTANNLNNNIFNSNESSAFNQEDLSEIFETALINKIPDQQESLSPGINSTKITYKATLKNIRIKRNNFNLTYYVMPSISYRHYSSNNFNNSVSQKPILAAEAGTHINYRLTKKLQFITGLQLDYSGYTIKANNVHPTVASLILNGEFAGQTTTYNAMSHYGNNPGNQDTKLKNYSLQLSLPVGFVYTFAGNNNIHFNAEATFQPTYIISDNSYMISSDRKNYLTAPDLSRKWNMSTNFGTFVSFRSNSFNWEIGPEIHYQLLSTYTNNYPFSEHLFNYGVHLGVSKTLK